MNKKVWILWIDHLDSYELVGIYSKPELAIKDANKIKPTTTIETRTLDKGASLFLEKD